MKADYFIDPAASEFASVTSYDARDRAEPLHHCHRFQQLMLFLAGFPPENLKRFDKLVPLSS